MKKLLVAAAVIGIVASMGTAASAAEVQTKDTVVKVSVPTEYTVTIPETIDLGTVNKKGADWMKTIVKKFDIGVRVDAVHEGEYVKVGFAKNPIRGTFYDNNSYLENEDKSRLNVSLNVDENATTCDASNFTEKNIEGRVKLEPYKIIYAGNYSGTVQFKIKVEK